MEYVLNVPGAMRISLKGPWKSAAPHGSACTMLKLEKDNQIRYLLLVRFSGNSSLDLWI